MAGSTSWPGANDSFALPVAGELLSGPVTSPSSSQVGSIGLAVEALQAWLRSAPVNNVATSGAAQTIPDPTDFPENVITLTANCALTFPPAVAGQSFVVMLIQDATGGRTVTWPAGTRWPGGTPPVLSALGGQIDIFTFACLVTHWNGLVVGQAMA